MVNKRTGGEGEVGGFDPDIFYVCKMNMKWNIFQIPQI